MCDVSANVRQPETERPEHRPSEVPVGNTAAMAEINVAHIPVGKVLSENGLFFEFSLWLSRACLGKKIVFMYKWL